MNVTFLRSRFVPSSEFDSSILVCDRNVNQRPTARSILRQAPRAANASAKGNCRIQPEIAKFPIANDLSILSIAVFSCVAALPFLGCTQGSPVTRISSRDYVVLSFLDRSASLMKTPIGTFHGGIVEQSSSPISYQRATNAAARSQQGRIGKSSSEISREGRRTWVIARPYSWFLISLLRSGYFCDIFECEDSAIVPFTLFTLSQYVEVLLYI